MPKLCDMEGVRSDEGLPVELWRDDDTGRLVAVAYNEAGYSSVDIDLLDLVQWLRTHEGGVLLHENGAADIPSGGNVQGDECGT